MTEFDVQPEAMIGSSAGIMSSAASLRAAMDSFESDIAAFGEPWGADDLGSLIGMAYLAIHDIAMECIDANIDDLEGYADGVNAMAERFQSAEDDIHAALTDLTRGLG